MFGNSSPWQTQQYQGAPYQPKAGDYTQLTRSPKTSALGNVPSSQNQGMTPWSPQLSMGQDGGIEGGSNFEMPGIEQLGKGVGIAGDLFGMYNQYQAMKMAKNQMNNQAKTSNYNMANNTNFKNSVGSVFGSAQPKIQNNFASMA